MVRQGEPGDASAPIVRTKGGYFGERALIHNEPQEASVRGTSDTLTCFRIAREVFDDLMNERIQALRQVKLFKSLNRSEIENAAEALEVVEFEEGEYVLRQHEQGSEFFMVDSGECVMKVHRGVVHRYSVV